MYWVELAGGSVINIDEADYLAPSKDDDEKWELYMKDGTVWHLGPSSTDIARKALLDRNHDADWKRFVREQNG